MVFPCLPGIFFHDYYTRKSLSAPQKAKSVKKTAKLEQLGIVK